MRSHFALLLLALFAVSTQAFFQKKPTPPAPAKAVKGKVAAKKPVVAKKVAAKRAAPVAPRLTRKPKAPLPVSKKSAPKAAPSRFSPKGMAAPGVSKQRGFKFGGRTPGPELYDDGLTVIERDYVERGMKQALTGAAKLRFTFKKQGGRGYNTD